MTIIHRVAAVTVAPALFLAASPLRAQTATEALDLRLDVTEECSVAASTMDFGSATPTTTGPLDTTSIIRVACNGNTNFRIEMDLGDNASGTQRRMGNGMGGFVNYQIYRNSNRTQLWGTGSNDSRQGVAVANVANEFTAYGRVPAFTPGSLSGSYLDTVTVTINF